MPLSTYGSYWWMYASTATSADATDALLIHEAIAPSPNCWLDFSPRPTDHQQLVKRGKER
jgi:hypothetical protein